MTIPTLIPFDLAAWKAGAKIQYRNGLLPKQVVHLEEAVKKARIISVKPNGGLGVHYIDGLIYDFEENEYDLRLVSPPKRVPLEAIDWIKGGPWWIQHISGSDLRLVTSISETGTVTADGGMKTSGQLLDSYRRTNDGATFSPCWKEVES